MRCAIAALVVLSIVGPALAACGPTPQRQWPIWTNGDIDNDPYFQPGPR